MKPVGGVMMAVYYMQGRNGRPGGKMMEWKPAYYIHEGLSVTGDSGGWGLTETSGGYALPLEWPDFNTAARAAWLIVELGKIRWKAVHHEKAEELKLGKVARAVHRALAGDWTVGTP